MARKSAQRVRVGVIGGGAAGIIAARWLRDAGHEVIVFEKASAPGGVWKYEDITNTDASMYKSLHTNLPTSVMQLSDFSFPSGLPSFPSHADVLAYLQSYARHFRVDDVIHLNSVVESVVRAETPAKTHKWRMRIAPATQLEEGSGGSYEEEVDKLLVCNGHFAKPFYPTIPGVEHFCGETLHSHNYRAPDAYIDKAGALFRNLLETSERWMLTQRVLLIGKGPSGQDISLELVRAGAKQVVVSFTEYNVEEPNAPEDKRILKPAIERITQEGLLVFADGSTLDESPDVIIFCTGYLYSVSEFLPSGVLYPQASTASSVKTLDVNLLEDMKDAARAGHVIAPLYKQLFAIEEPDIAFIGLPFKNLPFLCFELQAKWIAKVFSGGRQLPSKEQMYAEFTEDVRKLPSPARKFHQLGAEKQSQYFGELAKLSDTKLDENIQAMFEDAGYLRLNFPFEYRSAEYAKDTLSGKWVRTLRRSLESEDAQALVKQF